MNVAPRPILSGRWAIVLAAALGALDCTTTTDQPSDASAPLPCVPGQSMACAGPNACVGHQICDPDGKSYGACRCGAAPDASGEASGGDAGRDVQNGGDASMADSTLGDAATDSLLEDGPPVAETGGDATLSDGGPGSDASVNPLDGALFCSAFGCPPGTALGAGGACVYSCRLTGAGCSSISNALVGCDGGACVIAACDPGWADCDGNPANGCEADLTSPSTCTACTVACAAGEQCLSTGCVTTCAAPNTNCAGTCRDLMRDLHACGSCNKSCNPGETCSNGTCTCGPGYAMCNGGCVDTSSTPTACGSFCTACVRPPTTVNGRPLGFAGEECVTGACTTTCLAPYSACSGGCSNTATDVLNCGRCGTACAAGQVCLAGGCQALSAIQWISGVAPALLTQDSTKIYWTDPGDDTINLASKTTGQRVVLATSNSSALAADDAYVYWVDPATSNVYRVSQAGGVASQLATVPNPTTVIVVDGTSLYWDGGNGNYMKIPKAGGAATTFAMVPGAGGLASDGTNLYSLFDVQGPGATQTKGVYIIGKAGGATAIASTAGMGTFSTLSADGAGAYWLFNLAGVYIRGPTGSGSPPTLPSPGGPVPLPSVMASDGCGKIYWTTGGPDLWLLTGPGAAGVAVQVVTGGQKTTQLAVDNDFLYWTDSGGWIGRIAKY